MTEQRNLWVVEIDQGGATWTPIVYCFTKDAAEKQAGHIPTGKPVRVREYGKAADEGASQNL